MPHYDASAVQVHVLTFKEGMLSALAHDLKIVVTQAEVDVDLGAGTVSATFDASSLRVLTVMKKGQEARDELGPDHFKKIEKAIVEDVLHASKHPQITFVSNEIREQDGGLAIVGELELHGTRRSLQVFASKKDDAWVAELELHQPDYGIKPYTAMMGTLKVKPTLEIVVSIPA